MVNPGVVRLLLFLDVVCISVSSCQEVKGMSSIPDVVASDVDVKILDRILLPYYSWTSPFFFRVYADSPESGAMRDPEEFNVLGVTSDAFKGKKYYLSNEYRPSDDGAYGGWNRLYCDVFSKLRDSGCCAASYSRRKSGKKNHPTGYYTINCFHVDLEKYMQMRVQMIVYLMMIVKRVF